MSLIKIWGLKSVAGQLSDRLKIFAGQNENLPALSDSPAVFAKTGVRLEVRIVKLESGQDETRVTSY